MTDPKEQVVSEVLCRNHISGFGEVCAGVCGDSIVPGQPHPCEHALTVWRSDAQEILRALLARVDPKALEELDLASRAIERVRALLASSPSPAVRDALDHLHAMAPGIRDLDALDAVEKDDESMRSAVRDGLPTGRRHVLKTWPMYFQPLLDGKKTFELRKNDRDFRVGDILELREYDLKNDHYSGRITEVAVTYVLERGELGLAVGFCVLGIAAFSSPQQE